MTPLDRDSRDLSPEPIRRPGGDGVVVRLEQLSKRYGAIHALDGVSVELCRGEILSLCGHNGAGKSTLVRVLSGATQPDTGQVVLRGEPVSFGSPRQAQAAGIAVVDQELSIVAALSVEENLLLGAIDAPFFTRHTDVTALLRRVGLEHLDPTTPAERLSLAERQLVEIARALGRGADVLILDEPTATLSDVEIERVFAAVRGVAAEGCAVVFVSHRLGEVMDLSDRIVVLRDGRTVAEERVQDITRERLVELMIGQEVASVQRTTAGAAEGAAASTLEIAGVSVAGRLLPVDLTLRAGDVVALAGQVGSGASTLLRALAGLEPDARGRLRLDDRVLRMGSARDMARAGVAYVSNDRKGEGLFLGQTIQSNVLATRLPQLARLGLLRPAAMRDSAKTLTAAAGVDATRVGQDVATLSGGNQQKVFIGRCLGRSDVRVLLLDEPTRGVDVGGRAEIHALIRHAASTGMAVLFASTELDELLELPDVVITMRAGRTIGQHAVGVSAQTVLSDMTHADGPST